MSYSTALTKNAIWVAISSTLAGVCLWTAIMDHESSSTVSTKSVDRAISAITATAAEKVRAQDKAGDRFTAALGGDLAREGFKANYNCYKVRRDFESRCR